MLEKTRRGRGRAAASAVATMALFGGAAAVTGGTAASAVPGEDCLEALPVAAVADGDPVTGLTVTDGTTPVSFEGEILGVIPDGIAPDLDMIMARIDVAAMGVEDVNGIWQGMSGSPVYSADGTRLIGAVAYGLVWGETNIAGITPFEEMDDYLPTPPAQRVEVPEAAARKIAQDSDVTARQASRGFAKLGIPMGVSGTDDSRLAKAYREQQDRRGNYLHQDAYSMFPAAVGPNAAGPETIVPGGNLAASMSYGTVTMGGVGTATSVCEDGVVGFGHPASFSGDTTMSMHPADALFIQPGGGLDAPFKMANLGAPAGVIDGDHLSGISGSFGGTLPTADITTRVQFLDRQERVGETHVTLPDATASATFYQHLAMHDRAIDGITSGSELMTWEITGHDNGTPFALGMSDRFASNYDITFESPWDVADTTYLLSSFPGVTIDDVTISGAVTDDSSTWRVTGVQQRRDGRWVALNRRAPARAKAGRTMVLRAVLESTGSATRTVRLGLKVPAKAGGRGFLSVEGGAWQWSEYWEASSVDEITDTLSEQVRNDAVAATLYTENRRRSTRTTGASEPTDKVVYGGKQIPVRIR